MGKRNEGFKDKDIQAPGATKRKGGRKGSKGSKNKAGSRGSSRGSKGRKNKAGSRGSSRGSKGRKNKAGSRGSSRGSKGRKNKAGSRGSKGRKNKAGSRGSKGRKNKAGSRGSSRGSKGKKNKVIRPAITNNGNMVTKNSIITPATSNKVPVPVPSPYNSSLVANSIPGLTTSGTSGNLASFKDLGALVDSIKIFLELYEINKHYAKKVVRYNNLNVEAIDHILAIKDEMESGLIIDEYDYITGIRKEYETAIKEIKQVVENENNVKETTVEKPKFISLGEVLTVEDIETVISRGDKEKDRLSALRDADPVTKKRLANVLQVISDLKETTDKIKRNKMKIEDVPFSKKELSKLFSEISDEKKEVNQISKNKQSAVEMPMFNNDLVSQLTSIAGDISWDVRVGYDPEITIKRKALEHIDSIKKEAKSGKLSEDQVKNKMVEAKAIKQQYKTDNRRLITRSQNKEIQPHSKANNHACATEGYQPTPIEFTNGEKINQPLSFHTNESTDWYLRPGYQMTNEAIRGRAAAASFNPTQVGGPDYFKKSQFLCNQISDAGLGDPSEFGCIDSKVVVSPEYSWKGNYLMVCNRLGHIWGGWYPEMFGCPKNENSMIQAPNMKFNP